ncbi:MAG: rhodanese-like domain-containing protein [Gammaproteobacteria bacterium]|nr:rhodanese-like domain-containing protein [Gammaproteobacteria bacterium]
MKRIPLLFLAPLLFVASLALAVDLPVVEGNDAYISPESVAGAVTVDAAKAHELWKARAWFVDPRKAAQFESGHIPGALNLEYKPGKPNQPLTAESLEAQVPKTDPVVFYCNAEKCDRSSWGAALALEWGWKEVYYFRGGIPEWTKAGYPVQ